MSIRQFAPPGFVAIPATESDRRNMDLACHIGWWSKHAAGKLGAVIGDDQGHILSMGINGHGARVEDGDPANWIKPVRYAHSVHAEDNSFGNAKLTGADVTGKTMWLPRFPCDGDSNRDIKKESCADKIIAAGIGAVVVYSHPSDAEHKQHARSFARSLGKFIDAGIVIRWFDPNDPIYLKRMTRRPDTLPVPSGATDWDARFLDLAGYVSAWQAGGIGEVVVKRPSPVKGGKVLVQTIENKTVRAVACWSPDAKTGALETAQAIGGSEPVSLQDCTVYVSAVPDPGRLDRFAAAGLRAVVLPLTPQNAAWIAEHNPALRRMGLISSLMVPDLQPAPRVSAVEAARPAGLPQLFAL